MLHCRHWDATENCLQSDAAVAFALLRSFDAMRRYARALSLGACYLSTSCTRPASPLCCGSSLTVLLSSFAVALMAAMPLTTRLFAERFETPPHVLGQYVLYRLLQLLLSSQVVAVADWVLPKLLQQLP